MPSRSARRNVHNRLARSQWRLEASYCPLACRWLEYWQREAWHRAARLGAPAAWALLREPSVLAQLQSLDASGELATELARVIAEAVARAGDPRLVRGGRPLSQAVKSRG